MIFNKFRYFLFYAEYKNNTHPALAFKIKLGFINNFANKVENYKQKTSKGNKY